MRVGELLGDETGRCETSAAEVGGVLVGALC
jgi:hypothetical protein